MLLIDNVGQRLGSAVLDALLTSEIWQDRLRGRNTMLTLPNLLLVLATGNNLKLKADCPALHPPAVGRRGQHPEARSGFQYPDLEAHVAAQQPQLLAAALTLVRGYIAAGRPKQDVVTLGSFEGWSRLVQSAVMWAFGVDPGQARLVADDEVDLDKEILDTLTRGWLRLVPDGSSISCRGLMTKALEAGEGGRDILEALEMANASGKRTPVALGRLVTRFRKRIHRGSYFDHGSPDRTADGWLWRLFSLTT